MENPLVGSDKQWPGVDNHECNSDIHPRDGLVVEALGEDDADQCKEQDRNEISSTQAPYGEQEKRQQDQSGSVRTERCQLERSDTPVDRGFAQHARARKQRRTKNHEDVASATGDHARDRA